MATPHLLLDHIVGSQTNKETTANAGFDALDNAINDDLAITITGDYVLTDALLRGSVFFRLTGTPGAPFVFSLPTGQNRLFCIFNLSDSTALVEVFNSGTDVVEIAPGTGRVLFTDGSDLYALGGTGTGGAAGGGSDISVSTVTDVSYLMSDADFAGGIVLSYTGGFNSTFYIDSGLTGTQPVTIVQAGDSTVTFEEGSGVALLEVDGQLTTRGKGAVVQIIPLGSDTYVVVGATG